MPQRHLRAARWFAILGLFLAVGAFGSRPVLGESSSNGGHRAKLDRHLQDVKGRLNDVAYVEEKNRELIEEMIADPASHKWIRVYNDDIGEPGCKNWHVRPRWSLIGMLMGWWRVVISSGCPLAT